MIAVSNKQKRYMIQKGIPAETISVVRQQHILEFLGWQLEKMPRVPPQQFEFDFGPEFSFWWYDEDEVLHPNDTDYPSEPKLDYDNDIPF